MLAATPPMSHFAIAAILISLAATAAWLNARWLKLPTTIGLMLLALLHALGILGIGLIYPPILQMAQGLVGAIDFNATLLHGMLGYLLFAGALHINLNDLRQQQLAISLLATVAVLLTTFIVGGLTWWLTGVIQLELRLIDCLLFGALIAPTDPIAVLAILTKLGAPKSLETKIAGESLFNDGVGVVIFLALLSLAGSGHGQEDIGVGTITFMFAKEALGGVVLGLVLGLMGYLLLKSLDDFKTEILISLALVTGGYALCLSLHVSGPIAMVICGLAIGNHGRALAMSQTTREHLDSFWELVDEILNAILFVLIGLEVLVVNLAPTYLAVGLLAIPATLAARFVSVGAVVRALQWRRTFTPHVVKIMTWAGLRGGISIALALSLKDEAGSTQAGASDLIVTMTYVVVVFSILVQGVTIGPLLHRCGAITTTADTVSET